MTEINFNKLNFKTPREAVIYEVAHVMGMMKHEQEIQQEVFNYELMHNMTHQDTSSGYQLRLHSDKWFDGMAANINRLLELMEKHFPQ